MSFINQIDTSPNASAPQPRPNLVQQASNGIRNFGQEVAQSAAAAGRNAIADARAGAEGTVRDFANRSIDSLGRSVKDALSEEIAKRATNPIRDAIGKVGSGLLGDFFDGFLDAGQPVPPQYTGTMDQYQNSHEMYHGDMYALERYGLKKNSDSANDKHPAMKFMFAADFVFDPSAQHLSQAMMKSIPNALTTTLKNTTFPKVEIESDELNRYNRYIVSTKRVRYQPVTATFGETVGHNNGSGDGNMSLIEIWNAISAYYINDHQRIHELSGPFGHRSGAPRRNLLKFIDLYFIWPTSTRRLRLVNPTITGFSYDSLDYQTDEQILATFDIKYEYFELTQVNGSFANFINSTVGMNVAKGSPYEFTYSSPLKNMNVVSPDDDDDDQRMTALDSTYAQAMVQLVEQRVISSAAELLGSNDPVKRELGRQAVERSVDAVGTAAQVSGVTNAVRDMAKDAGRTANQALGGLF